ncbi:probable mediator of RNA polymerase II transcription subunit 26b isoform X1 [Rhodamnia argentea]|uniref:Probable mediator of RNA polymerase II transcription subunit 26b isoform X1 n=1 Tax=Rhodamnia argentea TaxID=178133 RepID=A0ABM3HM42_9MYRT|nr:probable mediator of RNA polymerase II transcription subunit 26b isoform X1 [Rhodamnia argentea]
MGESIDVWREFFRTTADTDVFEFIDKAIAIAALDRPKDFLLRRDRIAKRLFSGETAGARGDCAPASKESKANGNEGNVAHDVLNVKDSQGEAETFSDDMEETSQVVGEVLRIKRVLDNSRHESDPALHESLRRLESMSITVDILQKTKIGVSVNSLRRNCVSKKNAQLAHHITMGWKAMVEEIGRGKEDVADPGDVGDGKTSSIKEPRQEKYDINKASSLANWNLRLNVDQHKGTLNPNMSSNTNLRTVPASEVASRKSEKERMLQLQNSNGSGTGCRQPPANRQDKITGWKEVAADGKAQAAKRNMQGLYQKAETDKRQRTVQVLDPRDLPKMAASHKAPGATTAKAGRPRAISRSHNGKSLLERLRSSESRIVHSRPRS